MNDMILFDHDITYVISMIDVVGLMWMYGMT